MLKRNACLIGLIGTFRQIDSIKPKHESYIRVMFNTYHGWVGVSLEESGTICLGLIDRLSDTRVPRPCCAIFHLNFFLAGIDMIDDNERVSRQGKWYDILIVIDDAIIRAGGPRCAIIQFNFFSGGDR